MESHHITTADASLAEHPLPRRSGKVVNIQGLPLPEINPARCFNLSLAPASLVPCLPFPSLARDFRQDPATEENLKQQVIRAAPLTKYFKIKI